MMGHEIFLVVAGLLILITGGEMLVRSASSIALRMHISPLVVGLTIVAFGTSAPELFISVQSALAGSPDLAMGNVVGSNICNLGLVLGITALIFPVEVQPDSLRIDWPVTMGSSLLLFLLVLDKHLGMAEGVLFVFCLSVYTLFVIRKSQKDTLANRQVIEKDELPDRPSSHPGKDALMLLGGITGLAIGSDWFVEGAQGMALELGISERVVGITAVALGTSLPELFTSCIAAYRKQTDIAMGNLLGSNIYNVLSILGFTSMIRSIPVNPAIIYTDMSWMLAITLLVLPLMWTRRKIYRWEGLLLLMVYISYIYLVVA